MARDERAERSGEQLSGGRILVQALKAQGVERIYCVPGESYLPVLDALHDHPEIEVVSARHEGAAANMAEADGKLTGRPGVCFVTRGPGATHACVGVHTAFQDSTPMILFIGQVGRRARDREGFQEIDFPAMFAPLAKWAAQIDDAARIPEYLARAFRTATSGRQGPVVLSLPEDMLSELASAPSIAPIIASHAAPRPADLADLQARLAAAERPLLVVGGSGWTDVACAAVSDFARRNTLPLLASFRRQDLVDNRDEIYCGHMGLGIDPSLAERIRTSDLIVAIGARLSENATNGYTLLTPPQPSQALVHIHPDPEELGRVYQPSLAIACSPADFAAALPGLELPASADRAAWTREAREAYVNFSTPGPFVAGPYVDLAQVVSWLSGRLAEDAIVTNGAGNYAVWLHRYFRYRRRGQLAPTSGAMGYGVPAGIAAKLRDPARQVVALAGDGCFLMYPQEVGTAVQYGADVVFIVVNNGMYGTIRMHQERRFPGRVVATDIAGPDFVAMAESFGAYGERVESTDAFPDAFRRALAAGRPALLELRTDPAQLTPTLRMES